MALHTELPIHKVAYDLLDLATDLARGMPRDVKPLIGAALRDECFGVLLSALTASIGKQAHGWKKSPASSPVA